jgi:hypothetical protein
MSQKKILIQLPPKEDRLLDRHRGSIMRTTYARERLAKALREDEERRLAGEEKKGEPATAATA